MKLKTIIVFAVLSAILVIPFTNTYASKSDNVVKETRDLSAFKSIELVCSADVFITQGNTQSVVVEADEPLITHLYTEVKGDGLKIYIKDYRKSIHVAKVYITMPNLEAVSLVGSGDITLENTFKTNNFEIRIVGSGDLVAPLEAKNVKCSIAGSGDVKLSGVSGNFEVSVGGSGDTYAKDMKLTRCDVSIAGSGDVHISGSAVDFKVSVAGSGDTDAGDLKAVNVVAKIAGSGDVKITAVEDLTASIVGSGNVYYYGNPSQKKVNAIGSGRAIQK